MVGQTKTSHEIKVAVIIGGHPYDVPGFRDLFRRMEGIDFYIQELDNWASDEARVFDQYDVALFYNMHSWGILSLRKDRDQQIKDALQRLGETRQGIVLLHHALLAFPDSQTWCNICNIQNRELRGWAPGTLLHTRIVSAAHPITRGLQDWDMIDEPYVMDEPGESSDILLTTEHPKSMSTLAWVHPYRDARVFCYEGGHDNRTYLNPTFQTVVWRGIQWAAGRL